LSLKTNQFDENVRLNSIFIAYAGKYAFKGRY